MNIIYDQMEFHNVTALKTLDGFPGYKMVRFPDEVRDNVCTDVADMTRGVEIRFYVEPATGTKHGGQLYFMARDYEGEILLYWGDYQVNKPISVPVGMITAVPVDYPKNMDTFPEGRFPNRLCRIVMNNRSSIQYVGRENLNVRPPKEGEEPSEILVGYGSSITHGGAARSENYSYLPLTARMLGMDSLNFGFSGSCYAEGAVADFISQQTDASVYFLEFGTNMNHPVEEFYSRVEYFVNRVTKAHPNALFVVTGPYPRSSGPLTEPQASYASATEEIVQKIGNPNVHYIPSTTLMDDMTALISDGVHPSPYGHMIIANHLTEIIRKYR